MLLALLQADKESAIAEAKRRDFMLCILIRVLRALFLLLSLNPFFSSYGNKNYKTVFELFINVTEVAEVNKKDFVLCCSDEQITIRKPKIKQLSLMLAFAACQ